MSYTHATLIRAVADTIVMDETDLNIPNWILMAESYIRRKLNLARMSVYSESLVDVNGEVEIGTNVGRIESVHVYGVRSEMPLTPAESLAGDLPRTGRPQHYTIVGSKLKIYPQPSESTTLKVRFQKEISPLVNGPNDIADDYPDLYFYATLHHAEVYRKNMEAVAMYGQMRDAIIAELNAESNTTKVSPGDTLASPAAA